MIRPTNFFIYLPTSELRQISIKAAIHFLVILSDSTYLLYKNLFTLTLNEVFGSKLNLVGTFAKSFFEIVRTFLYLNKGKLTKTEGQVDKINITYRFSTK